MHPSDLYHIGCIFFNKGRKIMEFNNHPFIANGDLCLVLVDERISWQMENELKKRNIEILKSIECKNTYNSIGYHPDICVFYLGDGRIIVEPKVYEEYKSMLKGYGFKVLKGEREVKEKYPYNVHYNVAIVGEYAIHNFKYTDPTILRYIEENNLKKINIKQGYAKCSICIVDDKSIITSDEGIYNSLKETDIDCLLIRSGHIKLENMNYGFIGGCTGLISKNKIAFCGDVTNHPDYESIKEFLKSKNKEIVILSKEKLLDLGSIIPLMIRKGR